MLVKIIPDSSANMRTDENRNLISVPLKITTDEKEYIDNNELDVRAMAENLMTYKGKSGSACPGTGDWIEAFEGADWIFAVTITSNLSGCYNSARVAKEQYEEEHPEVKIHVIDSLSTGPEMKLIVEKLEELVAEGLDFDAICSEIEEYQKKTHLLFMLKSLNNLANNGRVSHAVAKITGVLGILLVGKASDVGTLEPTDKCRGEKKSIAIIFKNMIATGYAGGKVRIDHCFNEEAAIKLKEMIHAQFPDADVTIEPIHGLCCFYAELGGMLVGFEG